MSIATVVTRGYGGFGNIPFVVTRGYGDFGGDVVEETRRGGAFYPTPEELRRLRQELSQKLEAERAKETALEASLSEVYDDIVHPEIKAAKIAAIKAEQERLKLEMQDLNDMRDMLSMFLDYRRLH